MALDKATTMVLEQMAAAGGKPLHESTPEEARALAAGMSALNGPPPVTVSAEDREVAVEGGTIRVRILRPQQPARGVIVYYHGGGWVIGNIDEYDTLCRKLAERSSCAVVNVDYRLAPEHRYPVAVDDSYAALEWAAERIEEIAGRQVPLFIAGDSAGGNIAAVMAQRARDRNGPEIAMQMLVYPVTDCDFETPSYVAEENQLILTRETMEWFWDHYEPDPERRQEADASPLRASDFSGLPPAVVITAEHDVLCDEGEAYAQKLEAAGVPVDFKRHTGQTHGFFSLLVLPGGELAMQQIVGAIRRYLATHTRQQPSMATA